MKRQVRKNMKTIIAVPDFTRDAHLKKVLPDILKKLRKERVSNKDIEIIIATGLHRSPTRKEIRKNLGSIVDKIKVSVHNSGKGHVAYFGKTKRGVPIFLNKKIKDADSIITVGVVEPHLYAGYSGGTKVVVIGLAGEKTINATHHPRFLDQAGARICSIKKNPFRNFIEEVSSWLPIKYSVNIINDKNGDLKRVFQGNARSSFKKALNYSQKIFEKKIDSSFDVVICDIPKTKSINIYQASRAFNYVANTRKSVLKNNSLILVKADLKEGFGKGLGEKRFMNKITKMESPKRLIRDIKKRGCVAGEHRAYMVAKAALKAKLGFISKNSHLYKNKGLPFLFFKNLKEAFIFIKDHLKKEVRIHYLKNAFNTILVRNHN
ncbi:lactate racemase domain-containing protein [Candidatus Omnitrophota bacterium]